MVPTLSICLPKSVSRFQKVQPCGSLFAIRKHGVNPSCQACTHMAANFPAKEFCRHFSQKEIAPAACLQDMGTSKYYCFLSMPVLYFRRQLSSSQQKTDFLFFSSGNSPTATANILRVHFASTFTYSVCKWCQKRYALPWLFFSCAKTCSSSIDLRRLTARCCFLLKHASSTCTLKKNCATEVQNVLTPRLPVLIVVILE